MGAVVKVNYGQLPVGTGTFDITNTDEGTPVAAIVCIGYGVTAGTAATHSNMSIGWTDGTTHRFGSVSDEDGQATTDTYGVCGPDLGELCTPGTGTVEVKLTFDSWITDGIRINQATATGNQERYCIVLFYGTDVSAHVESQSAGTSVDEVTNIETVGFVPEVVLIQWCGKTRYNFRSVGAGNILSLGWSWKDGASYVMRSIMRQSVDNQAAGDPRGRYSEAYAGGTSFAQHFEVNDFDADGFSLTSRNAGAGGLDFAWLALSFDGAIDLWAGTHTTPTSTGNEAETGPGFTPQAVLNVGGLFDSVDTTETDGTAGSMCFGAFDDTTEASICQTTEDAADTTDTQSMVDAQALNVPDHDGTAGYEATFVSFDANGYTLDYDPVLGGGATANVAVLAFGAAEIAPSETVGTSVGAATVLGVGASTAGGVGVSTGGAIVTGVGASIVGAVGSSTGGATVSGVGASLAGAVGSSVGAAIVTGVGATGEFGAYIVDLTVSLADTVNKTVDLADQWDGETELADTVDLDVTLE